jgi:hypothetical protein
MQVCIIIDNTDYSRPVSGILSVKLMKLISVVFSRIKSLSIAKKVLFLEHIMKTAIGSLLLRV